MPSSRRMLCTTRSARPIVREHHRYAARVGPIVRDFLNRLPRRVLDGVIVGGDYAKETEAPTTWRRRAMGVRHGGSSPRAACPGLGSVVKHVPQTTVHVGGRQVRRAPTSRWTTDGRGRRHGDGRVSMPGFDTLSFVPREPIAWAAGAKGALARMSGVLNRLPVAGSRFPTRAP